MSNGIKIVFAHQGMIIGKAEDFYVNNGEITLNNPALVIMRQNEVALVPLLTLVEETKVTFELKSLPISAVFTPKRELENHYNQIFGSGLVLTTSMPAS